MLEPMGPDDRKGTPAEPASARPPASPLGGGQLRAGCCVGWPKPCAYHEGWLDGWDARDALEVRSDGGAGS